MAQFSPREILARSERNVHPPMHFLLLSGWRQLFGGSLICLRYYALLWGLATIIGGYFLAEGALSSTKPNSHSVFAGLLAAALIALSPLHIHWSQQVKMYSLGTCLTVWSTWFLLRWFQSGGIWRLICYVLLAATLSLQHHYGTFTVFGQLAFALAWSASRSLSAKKVNDFFTIFLTGWATTSLWALWLPSFLVQRTLVKNGYWIEKFDWQVVENVWSDLFVAQTSLKASSDISLIIALLVLVTVSLLLVHRKTGSRMVGWLVLMPYAIAVTWSILDENVLVSRFLINAHTCLLVGIAILAASIPLGTIRYAVSSVLILTIFFTMYQQRLQRTRLAAVRGMPEAISTLRDAKAVDEPVLVCNPMLYLNLCVHNEGLETESLEDAYAFDPGYAFPHFQGAPVMKNDEYYSVEALRENHHDWVWTLDADNWLGASWKVRLPKEWKLQEQRAVKEWYGVLLIRVYRKTDGSENSGHQLIDKSRGT